MNCRHPNIWIIIDPKGDVVDVALSRATAEKRLLAFSGRWDDLSQPEYPTYEAYIVHCEYARNKMLEDGWEIKEGSLVHDDYDEVLIKGTDAFLDKIMGLFRDMVVLHQYPADKVVWDLMAEYEALTKLNQDTN